MQTLPLILKIPSQKYSNIVYSVYINSFDPESGTLNHALLRNNVNVSCHINVKDSLLDDYEYAIITLAYKQVKTKAKRYKSLLASPLNNSNVLYRNGLDELIEQYKPLVVKEDYSEFRALLLNDITSPQDAKVGDTGLQCMFRFQKFDGSSEFFLSPGSPLSHLSSIIGLSVFEASSVNEVLDAIIFDMSELLKQHVLPKSGLNNSVDLDNDIKRYLRFSFYGE